MQTLDKSNQVLDSGGSLKLPGESDPEFAKIVHDYLKHFSYYRIQKNYAVRDHVYKWCAEYLGEKYKDWFIHEGGKYDKWWTVNIKSPKHCTLFALRWSDIILEYVDKDNKL